MVLNRPCKIYRTGVQRCCHSRRYARDNGVCRPAQFGLVVLHRGYYLLLDLFVLFLARSFEFYGYVVVVRITIIIIMAIRNYIFTAPENSTTLIALQVGQLIAFVMHISFNEG